MSKDPREGEGYDPVIVSQEDYMRKVAERNAEEAEEPEDEEEDDLSDLKDIEETLGKEKAKDSIAQDEQVVKDWT